MREGERQDDFYTAHDTQEDDVEVDSDCDDQEYYRRVAEEVARRKSGAYNNNPVARQQGSTHGSTHGGSNLGGSTHGSSPGRVMNNSSHGQPSPAQSAPAPKLSISPPGSGKHEPVAVVPPSAPPSVTTTPRTPAVAQTSLQTVTPVTPVTATPVTPVTPLPPPAPVSTVASRAAASRPHSATTAPAAVTTSFVVSKDRPFSATSVPGTTLPAHIPVAEPATKYGRPNPSLVPDEKVLKTLVMMGFTKPAATMALQRTNNNSEQATQFLLEHSEEELNTMLGV